MVEHQIVSRGWTQMHSLRSQAMNSGSRLRSSVAQHRIYFPSSLSSSSLNASTPSRFSPLTSPASLAMMR